MALGGTQKRHLRGLAHHLAPIVQVGKQGITDSVVNATEQALLQHELIKVRLPQIDRAERSDMASALEQRTRAHLAGVTGRIAILYRRHPDEPKIKLPK